MALSKVDELLSSDEKDLQKLAKIAGVAPEVLYAGADLTGLDLREQDVTFLIDLGTRFEKAILTTTQRKILVIGKNRESGSNSTYETRVGLISHFIETFARPNQPDYSVDGKVLGVTTLAELLLRPVVERKTQKSTNQFGKVYMSAALRGLEPWAVHDMGPFFQALFELFGELNCPVDSGVISAMSTIYRMAFRWDVVRLVASMRPTASLDKWWVLEAEIDESAIDRAMALGRLRGIHPDAIEACLSTTDSIEELVKFLEIVDAKIDSDQAERMAYQITKAKWPPLATTTVLNTSRNPRLRGALFRQLLLQGDEGRTIEIVRWLDNSRGAAGALSLENAFVHIKNFHPALTLAQELAPRLKQNQMDVIDSALGSIAFLPQDLDRLSAFRRRYVVRSKEYQERLASTYPN